jgi:RNA polymerase sigma factor (sigma-70 family)
VNDPKPCAADVEHLLRDLAPRAIVAVVRRYRHFADAEDAVQEALVSASTSWPSAGVPDNPLAWLVRVASRRLTDLFRSEEARRRREDIAASWSRDPPPPAAGRDDTLTLVFMCCHPSLTPASAIALTLRAVGGLTTREIASAFLVPEATMAQRISRAKRTIVQSGGSFALPVAAEREERLAVVLRVVYLIFNEGYTASGGSDLGRVDLASEAIRIGRLLHELLPENSEVAGLSALMFLTEARRPARTTDTGALVALESQDRKRWNRALITEGTALATTAFRQGPVGEYGVQAAIAALHDNAPRYEDTDWVRILSLYETLERLTGNSVVRLNRAVAAAMVEGPNAALALLDALPEGDPVRDSHRLQSVRAHLLEMQGDVAAARTAYMEAATGTSNLRERDYLMMRAAALLGDERGDSS